MNTKNTKILRAVPYLLLFFLALAVWLYFQTNHSYSFYYKEQNQLFLMSSDYISTYFTKPAWAACLVGDFITQFFYYMYAGSAIFALLILILATVVFKSLRLAGFNLTISLLAAIFAMGIETSMNFNPDFRMSSLICALGGVLSFLPYSLANRQKASIRIVLLIVFGALSAWMFNFGFIVFIILVATTELSLLARHADNSIAKSKAGFALLPLCAVLTIAYYNATFAYPVNPDTCHSYPGTGRIDYPNEGVKNYLEAENLYYFGRYDELIKKVEAMKNPSPEVTFYYYLAIAQRGLLPHKLNRVKPVNLGTLYEIGPKSTPAEIKMVNELYFAFGDMTLAEREALLTCVFSYDNRNVRMIKRLAECNLVAGDNEAAMKYLRILDNTIAYKKWAQANRPGKINLKLNNLKQYAVKDDTIRLNARFRDVLTNLLKANPRNHMALDYLLCTDYLVGAREMFINDIKEYYIPQYGMPTEPMYRELYK